MSPPPQAEAWLQEQAQRQGWSRASAVRERRAREGLVGLLREGTAAVMVEVGDVRGTQGHPPEEGTGGSLSLSLPQVNCETDFVARNAEFQRLVEQAALSTMALCRATAEPQDGCTKVGGVEGGTAGREGVTQTPPRAPPKTSPLSPSTCCRRRSWPSSGRGRGGLCSVTTLRWP